MLENSENNLYNTIRYYAGIGSRKTPEEILVIMTHIAVRMRNLGWVLRSGCALGADTAFENGAGNLKELFVAKATKNVNARLPTPECFTIAATLHPAWYGLSAYVQALMARNIQQILGYDLQTPASMVVCWTPDGCESHKDRSYKTGGTGQAISCASNNGIPVYNIKNKESLIKLEAYIAKLEYDLLITSIIPKRIRGTSN